MGITLIRTLQTLVEKMKAAALLLVVAISYATAQDTYHCPDGWELFEHDGRGDKECSCFLFPTTLARVTHGDAQLLCEGHNAYLAEPRDGPPNNYWIVEQLQNRLNKRASVSDKDGLEGPHYEDQWWMGGKSYTKHNTHNPGEWVWENSNITVEWFDWAPGEPNDYHRQQCLAYLRYNYFGNPTYQWNDWDCNTVADYICEKACDTFME